LLLKHYHQVTALLSAQAEQQEHNLLELLEHLVLIHNLGH
jgi:hypothetical protein